MKKLNELTVEEAVQGLLTKQFSSLELTEAVLSQIETYNHRYNIFLSINKNAKKQAKEADTQRQNTKEKTPYLLGIPIAVKDNFLTCGIPTTASSNVLKEYLPVYESTVTKRLKENGAIIIGKTNLDAWAHGSSTETSDFGATKNPWDDSRLPGGSSGGSAAAVSADMCMGAIGSETAGSIRQPAAWCGCVGMKPNYGRVSRYGVIAMASSTDSPGPMTKCVKDAELLLEIIAGQDPYDATSIEGTWKYQKQTKKPKLGIVTDYFVNTSYKGVNAMVMDAIKLLQNAGYETEEVSLLDPKYAIADYTVLQRAEVSSNLARYDGIRYGNDRSAFALEAKRRIMLGTYVLSAGFSSRYYKKGQKVRTMLINDFNNVFKRVDVLVAPTSPTIALPIGATENASMFGEIQDMLVEASSLAGLPGINMPCGFIDGLPVGLQITGKLHDEQTVFLVANDYEKLTNWLHKKPNLIP